MEQQSEQTIKTRAPWTAAQIGRLGGLARARNLSPQRRREIAVKAGKARQRAARKLRREHERAARGQKT